TFTFDRAASLEERYNDKNKFPPTHLPGLERANRKTNNRTELNPPDDAFYSVRNNS
ncbi:unnamed protein product, partial [Amoebophrya sp. A120]